MREIIFRGKRIDNGEWVEGYLFDDGKGPVGSHRFFVGDIVVNNNTDSTSDEYSVEIAFEEVDKATIGQYTGIQDKNGKRVFEADIITVPWSQYRWIVKFCDGQFLGVSEKKLRSNEFSADIIVGCSNGVEVIGNIHDNPDLLDVTP